MTLQKQQMMQGFANLLNSDGDMLDRAFETANTTAGDTNGTKNTIDQMNEDALEDQLNGP